MFSNHTYKASYLLTLISIFILPSVFNVSKANQSTNLPKLIIKPTKCVSLQQAQSCFVTAVISWQATEAGSYCLISSQQQSPLQCWSSALKGTFSQEIKMDGDVTYMLTDQKNKQILVSSVLPLAWVYKKEKFSHSSWRVF